MKKAFIYLTIGLLVGWILSVYVSGHGRGASGRGTGKKVLYYVDPMHPSYRSDKPGIAPDCGMQLEPVYEEGTLPAAASAGKGAFPPGTVEVTPDRQQIIGVKVATVEQAPWSATIRVLGRVAPDEARLYRINSSSDLWVRKMFTATTGSFVKRDELLLSFYNTNFLSAAGAYMYALNTLDKYKEANSPEQLATFNYQVRQAVETLQNLGVSDTQIREMEKKRTMSDFIDVRSPTSGIVLSRNVSLGQWVPAGTELYRIADLSKVWIFADLFESESRLFTPGMRVEVHHASLQKRFAARVSAILPEFDPTSRTMRVRLEADNPGYLLRPGMFVDLELPEQNGAAIAVPVDAVLDSGLKKTVYVDRGNGFFEPREVKTGRFLGDRVEIARGLKPGEKIVVSGNFLLDSESRLNTASLPAGAASQDPSCGMYVNEEKAREAGNSVTFQGKTYYFCSRECRLKFTQEPGSSAEKPAAGMHRDDAGHGGKHHD